jgi:hypothetical protein
MPGVEVSSGELKRRLNESQRSEVDHHLASGRGVALYEDERGSPKLVVPTGGGKGYDIPGFPPTYYGGGTLSMFVPPQKAPAPLRSPLMDHVPPPQIHRPRVAPSHTEYPSVAIEMRTRRHPRGNSDYITPLLPGRAVESPAQVPPSKPLGWWARRLLGREERS